MKKILSLLLVAAMTISIASCGTKSTDADKETATESSNVSTDTESKNADNAAFKEGLTGEGEKQLDNMFATFTVPAGYKFEVYCYSVDEDDFSGTLQLDIGKTSTLDARYEISTTRMISSVDDSMKECIRTLNLDSFNNAKEPEYLPDVVIGDKTFKAVHIDDGYSKKTYLTSYYKRGEQDVFVQLSLDEASITVNDTFVKDFLGSVNYK